MLSFLLFEQPNQSYLINYAKMSRFCHFRGGGGPVNAREFNIGIVFFVEANISPQPSIVPSLSEIRDLSIITPCLVLLWTQS